jgi:hypothetical protein
MEGKPFVLIGVNSDREKDFVKKQNEKEQITWRSFWCGDQGTSGPIPSAWNVHSWPTLYFIDHDGVIRAKNPNHEDEKELDELIDKLVEKAEKGTKSKGQ